MCKAHIVRFRCRHGLLMGFETCPVPCPKIETTSGKMATQPSRCYNCEHKIQSKRPTSRRQTSCLPAVLPIVDEDGARPYSAPSRSTTWPTVAERKCDVLTTNTHRRVIWEDGPCNPFQRRHTFSVSSTSTTLVDHLLPNVAVQPKSCIQLGSSFTSHKPFRFECQSADHIPPPHYMSLPSHLPHSDHVCPACQIQRLREEDTAQTVSRARQNYSSLAPDQMVMGNGKEKRAVGKPTMAAYLEENAEEVKQRWLALTRQWTEVLEHKNVLMAQEDGMGLYD